MNKSNMSSNEGYIEWGDIGKTLSLMIGVNGMFIGMVVFLIWSATK